MRQALRFARKHGFTTRREDGTWYINRPYHRAAYLLVIDDDVVVGYPRYLGCDTYEPLETLISPPLPLAMSA